MKKTVIIKKKGFIFLGLGNFHGERNINTDTKSINRVRKNVKKTGVTLDPWTNDDAVSSKKILLWNLLMVKKEKKEVINEALVSNYDCTTLSNNDYHLLSSISDGASDLIATYDDDASEVSTSVVYLEEVSDLSSSKVRISKE